MREANEVKEWLKKAGEEATVEEARLAIKTIKKIAALMRSQFPSELLRSAEK